jgi:hypothetical protein
MWPNAAKPLCALCVNLSALCVKKNSVLTAKNAKRFSRVSSSFFLKGMWPNAAKPLVALCFKNFRALSSK